MKLFLAGTSWFPELLDVSMTSPYILESYAYFEEWQKPLITTSKMFLLDSGAFSIRQNSHKPNYERYLRDYIDFINANDIQYFFELDIDNIIGYDKVKIYRKELENSTRKKCIPVWHPNRGKLDYEEMCDNYDYVSVGGIAGASLQVKRNYIQLFPALIKIAHQKNAKIHGLGCTSDRIVQNYRFDSVDSTSWTGGGRWGQAYIFDGKHMQTKKISREDKRIKDMQTLTMSNLQEWIKYQNYAERRL